MIGGLLGQVITGIGTIAGTETPAEGPSSVTTEAGDSYTVQPQAGGPANAVIFIPQTAAATGRIPQWVWIAGLAVLVWRVAVR